jgi:hypothetical protein
VSFPSVKTPQQAFPFVVGDYIPIYLLPYPERPTPDDGMVELCAPRMLQQRSVSPLRLQEWG